MSTSESKLEKVQRVVIVSATLAAGVWALYTYELSEEARYKDRIRSLEYKSHPSVLIESVSFAPLDGNRLRGKISVTITNHLTETINIDVPDEEHALASMYPVIDNAGSVALGEGINLIEGVSGAPSIETTELDEIWSGYTVNANWLQAGIEIPIGRSVTLHYLTPAIKSGFYKISFKGVASANRKSSVDHASYHVEAYDYTYFGAAEVN